MGQVDLEKALPAGREAVRNHRWREAYELLAAVDRPGTLDASDLEGLAEAAWWNGRMDACISARERAFALWLEAGEPRRAALIAVDLSRDHGVRGARAVGAAWLNRAQRLLQHEPVGIEHGYLARLEGVIAYNKADFAQALAIAQQVVEIGTRFGSRDLMALGMQAQGQALIAQGQFDEGMALLDQATVAALSGEIRPLSTGIIYCNTISASMELADYRRASDWTDAARRWCERQTIAGFPGMCRVHRAGIVWLSGAWQEAEQEARNAYDEVRDFNVGYAAEALYQIGEIRLYRGDLVEAGDAFRQAHELGREPNPGLALLRLAEGDVGAATASIKRGLAAENHPVARAQLLPAQVTIAVAAGDAATAAAAATELESISATYTTGAIRARARHARAAVALLQGDPEKAVRDFCEALALWREVGVPYEEAKTRVGLAAAYEGGGDPDGAGLELHAARTTFARLGAALDERKVGQMLDDAGAPPRQSTHGDTATRTFMFTDIVKSTELVGAIGDDAWNDLLHWHDQTLRALIARHAGEQISHTGDGYFAAFTDPASAIGCAIEIQRTLAVHRREHGFAVPVRIGIHQAPATRVGLDYRGKGVHEAARIGANAQGGEILATWHTAQPCKFTTSEPRALTLKGIAEPIQVVSVNWR